MTPFEFVQQHYSFPKEVHGNPFVPHPLQVEVINNTAPLPNSGDWLEMATGKTFVATAKALYAKAKTGSHTVVILPPHLITQWGKWLRLIKPALSITEYFGTPPERKALSLDADFVIVGIQIFKKEYRRFVDFYVNRAVTIIVDEADFIAGIGSDAHEKVYDFCIGRTKMLLSGTPINNPMNAYGLLKFTSPGTYRNLKHFESQHVDERDFYDKPIKWRNVEELNANVMKNASRILYRDMYPDADKPFIDTVEYKLEPDHYKLYRKLAEEEILKLEDGGKLDATTTGRLRHALGQLVVNYGHFAQDPKKKSNAVNMIEEKLHALGDGKLVVFADYKMTVRNLVQTFQKDGARAYNGEVTARQKDINKEAFIEDPKCRLLIVQYLSGGKGLDGLQYASNTALFIEPTQQPRDFWQALARLVRPGQTKRVMAYIAIAQRTLQPKGFEALLKNDTLVNQIIRSFAELRMIVYGEQE